MKELMLVRLRNQDDIIGYVTDNVSTITISKPLAIEVENFLEEGKQFIAMREYVPQSIVDMTSVTFKKSEVIFMHKVRKAFADEYTELANMFYEAAPKLRTPRKGIDATEKVISLMDALSDKKDKPVH